MSVKKSHVIILRGGSFSWLTSIGTRFRDGLRKIANSGIAVGLGGRKLGTLGNIDVYGLDGEEFKELREVVKAFNEAEQSHINSESSGSLELGQRVLESQTKIIEAKSRLAQIKAVKAEIRLVEKLKQLGIELKVDQNGVLTILPTPTRSQHTESREWLGPGRRSPKP